MEDVEGKELESSKVSIINLVDLAGSERVAAAHSHGDRLKVKYVLSVYKVQHYQYLFFI